ncbi:MAG: hypothetical protein LBV13_01685 [Methanomassiliicoccaceae archaeon]|nr:hypothetical protein [Methanomassiliicoccaceae archaeon]
MPPQISLYIDQILYMDIQARAKDKGVSLSSYVADMIREGHKGERPDDYINLFGSWADEPMGNPEDIPFDQDDRR